jgi:putative hydrolase of the HAD superfamily
VTFDVGGTLIDPYPSVGHIYADVAARNGERGISPALLSRRFGAAWRALKHFRYTRGEWARLVEATFRGLTKRPPRRTFFPALYDRFSQPQAWRIYDDVLPALETLAARGLKLGIISNWDERLRPLLHALELHRHFDAIVVSSEVGVAKPARGIFHRATADLRLAPEMLLHVGDSPALDVRGARAAGLQARLLRRKAKRRVPGEIRSLAELTDCIYNPDPKA